MDSGVWRPSSVTKNYDDKGGNLQVVFTLLVFLLPMSLLFQFQKRSKKRLDGIKYKEKRCKARRRGKGKGRSNRAKSSKKRNAKSSTSAFQSDHSSGSSSSFFFSLLSRMLGRDIGNASQTCDDKKELSVTFVAMDCEMVGVGRQGMDSMLARCSLVTIAESIPNAETGTNATNDEITKCKINVLYDVYVKPTKFVTDYRTEYSGITPDHLNRKDAVTFEVCRSKVISLLKPQEHKIFVLVGHALKNDFQCLRYWHPRLLVRDTAYYRPFMTPVRKRFRPQKLSFLAKQYLGVQIQQNKSIFYIDYGDNADAREEHGEGHSSVEDAAAALLLYQKFSATWEEKLGHPLSQRRATWWA